MHKFYQTAYFIVFIDLKNDRICYMRIAALDVAQNRIGIAMSNEDCEFITYSYSLSVTNKIFRKQLSQIYRKYSPIHTYIGLPLYNNQSNQYKFIKRFSHNYRDIIGKFDFVDEGGTTIMANQFSYYYAKFDKDAKAAEIILESKILQFRHKNIKSLD